jgi:hypothetical protein
MKVNKIIMQKFRLSSLGIHPYYRANRRKAMDGAFLAFGGLILAILGLGLAILGGL